MVDNKEQQLIEKMISVNRVTKVVKGGRIMGFTALTVVGDGNGSIGMGKAKAKEVPVAVQKAMKDARKNMVKVSLHKGTVCHDIVANHDATTIYLRPAKEGTGIIAGGAMRTLFEAVGIKNITAKVQGSSSPYNVVRATLKALQSSHTASMIAHKRGKTVQYVLGIEENPEEAQQD